jgi:hypothetical protein
MLANTRDLRKAIRRPTDLAARICLDATKPDLHCRILDISDQGAGLLVPSPPAGGLPDQFTLLLGPDGCVKWQCQLIWTNANRVGVKFAKTPVAR